MALLGYPTSFFFLVLFNTNKEICVISLPRGKEGAEADYDTRS